MPKDKEFQPTSGKEWRKAREVGQLEELPSGKVVLLGKIRLRDLLTKGDIPNPLMPVVVDMMAGKKWTPGSAEDVQLYFDLLDYVCVKGFRNPRIVEEPEADDEISIQDVDFDDQLAVFNKVQQEIRFFQPFRPQPQPDVAGTRDGEDVPGDAEPDDGD